MRSLQLVAPDDVALPICPTATDARQPAPPSSDRVRRLRIHPRTHVHLRAVVETAGSFRTTVIRDISVGGLGLKGADGLFPGCEVEVTLLTGQSRKGIVRWWLAGCCGIEFQAKLEPGDPFLEAVLTRGVNRAARPD
jgi:hypothetical protein